MTKPGFAPPPPEGGEREAFGGLAPAGFHLKPPPPPSGLTSFQTSDADLFETIHMGAAVVDPGKWRLVVDGMVKTPFSIDLATLKSLPSLEVTAFHECYGSPLKPPTEALRRIGNVVWKGVRLNTLLREAGVEDDARYIWSDGLDSGEFGGRRMDRYRKDLPIEKALADEVLVAYALNGEPLGKARGGPVRLVVPGWFGTNMTKWLCRLSARAERADSPFTTVWYNEEQIVNGETVRKPIWSVTPNSIIVEPAPDTAIAGTTIQVRGWAWAGVRIERVDLSADDGLTWQSAQVASRQGFEWQAFTGTLELPGRENVIVARSFATDGQAQPLHPWRNGVHKVTVFRGSTQASP